MQDSNDPKGPQQHGIQAIAPEDRVPLISKIVYGLGVAGDSWGHWGYVALAFPVFTLYLKVNPVYFGIALALTRLFDALTDPILGSISDNARTRWGRRRPFILIGSILAGIGLPFLFFVTPGWGDTHLRLGLHDLTISNYFWFMLISAMIYAPVMSSYNVPYYSLGAELTPDYLERTNLMSFRGVIQKILEVFNFGAYRFTQTGFFALGIDAATGHRTYNTLRGAQVFAAIMGGLLIIIGVLNFFFVKERYFDKIKERQTEKVRLSESFFRTLKCRPFLLIVLLGLSFNLGSGIVGLLGFNTTVFHVAGGDQAVASSWNFWMGVAGMLGGVVGVPLINLLSRRLGKRHALMVNLTFGMVVFASTWWLYSPRFPWLQTVASGTIGLCGAALWVIHGSLGADVIDYDEIQSHKRREGAFSACSSWIMKLSVSFSMLASGILLNAAGFDANKAQQSVEAITNIRLLLAGIPFFGTAVALLMVYLYPLTRERMAEVRVQLEARRGKM
jgi:GPH family glycoside/pentoside/hexuronide:cation symporter